MARVERELVPFRKREHKKNPLRDHALEIAKMPRGSYNVPARKRLEFLATEYEENVRGTSTFLTKNEDNPEFAQGIIMKGDVQWSKKTAKKTCRRLLGIKSPTSCGITLTIRKDPSRSVHEDFRFAQRSWNIFLTMLRKRFSIKFVRCWELGRSNTNVHIHGVLLGVVPSAEFKKWVRNTWNSITGSFQTKVSHGGVNAHDYLKKHLIEAANFKTGHDQALLLWASRVRRYSASIGLLCLNPPPSWTWQGFLFGPEWEEERFLIRTGPPPEPPPQQPPPTLQTG